MRIGLIADAYPPLRTSGAVQMRDLARALAEAGHETIMIVPAPGQDEAWRLDQDGAVQVLRLRAPRTKDVSYFRRTLTEMAMPFVMARNLRRSGLDRLHFDGIAWYSPSVFFAPLVRALRRRSGCRTYLILRDIFPEWLADMGVIRRGPVFWGLRAVSRRQYKAADMVGVQTPANLPLVKPWVGAKTEVELLENWLAPLVRRGCSIDLSQSPVAGRRIFVYAGNMGVAQGVDRLLDLATDLRDRVDIGFVFVGRGSDVARLRATATARGLDNTLFYNEIDPDDIPGLYAQCHVGLVALDPRHKTHNIPGKFISYMHAGLPVLATINPGNDLIGLIEKEGVGRVAVAGDEDDLAALATCLIDQDMDVSMPARCRALAARRFAAAKAAAQIVNALTPADGLDGRRRRQSLEIAGGIAPIRQLGEPSLPLKP
jgi:glycosyltransferase involved in cell wall biosynthesis